MFNLILIILASFGISLLSLVGIFILKGVISSQRATFYLVSFAAGVMLAAAFLDLLPEALGESVGFSVFVLAGIVLSFFMERFLFWFHHHHGAHGMKPSVFLVLIGDAFHNFVDGIAISASFLASPEIGVSTTLAIALHEIPQEFADFSILVHSGMRKSRALLLNFISALTAVLGAVLGFYFLTQFESIIPKILALTAGMFIYISCADLIPDLHEDFKKQQGWIQSLPFIVGIVIMYIMIRFLD